MFLPTNDQVLFRPTFEGGGHMQRNAVQVGEFYNPDLRELSQEEWGCWTFGAVSTIKPGAMKVRCRLDLGFRASNLLWTGRPSGHTHHVLTHADKASYDPTRIHTLSPPGYHTCSLRGVGEEEASLL
jgi:hypothetical protein